MSPYLWIVLAVISWPVIGALSTYALEGWKTYRTNKDRDDLRYCIWAGWFALVTLAIAILVVLVKGFFKVIKIIWNEGIMAGLYYMAGYRKPARSKKNADHRPKKSGKKK